MRTFKKYLQEMAFGLGSGGQEMTIQEIMEFIVENTYTENLKRVYSKYFL